MGYEFDFDEELDTAAFKSIDELLTEGSLARKGSITEESISDENLKGSSLRQSLTNLIFIQKIQ